MNAPDLSQFHTLIRAHALINHYSKSEIFINNALDIKKLGEDLLAYRQWWTDQQRTVTRRNFIISILMVILAVANVIITISLPNSGFSTPFGLLIIAVSGWCFWSNKTIEKRLIKKYEAKGYPYLSHEEVNVWIELMESYVEVHHEDDNDQLWNQAVIKLNTIRHPITVEKIR